MEWCKGMDETRLLIAHSANADGVGRLLSLQHPKSGKTTCYLLNNRMLQELHWFKQSYTSWFLGDYVCQDGCLYSATPVDPVFILLPIFEEARMRKGDDPGKFRQLDEILFINGYPGYRYLMPIAENCMQVVCEIKEIGSSKFFRLNDSKVFAWLLCKVSQLKQAVSSLDKNYAAQDEKNTLADAIMILGEYLKDEPWLKLLCNHLKLNLLEATRKVPDAETSLTENNPASSNLMQEKGKNDGKTKRTGKQAKKAKVETESLNIREMFSRASRRR
ncbi:ribonuclease H2 subunit B [Ricinus communis]|uniref:ribonuclease H2 subunit B n=1 Tax=Ricinus communis TaxID=3988 RepID=UPI0007727231|nr:ribonuclease H2 subunit B [Ricinus communis]|eukprot:XP_015573896.1 ribonuclease H2 subunit B [Ricinus communis]